MKNSIYYLQLPCARTENKAYLQSAKISSTVLLLSIFCTTVVFIVVVRLILQIY